MPQTLSRVIASYLWMRARLYHPGIGRFISQDTYAYDWQHPVEANRYGYTTNNPATLWKLLDRLVKAE